MDYCNSVLYGAPSSSIQMLQRAQNNEARIVLQAPRRCHARPLLRDLHWLPIQHRILYKVAVLTFKSRSSATAPTYLSRHIKARVSERTLIYWTSRSQERTLRIEPFALWNSLPETIIRCDSLSIFKSKLKTYFFHKAFD